jgi:hypothetical protein
MLFPSCSRILLFPLLSSPHGPNKVVLDPFCTWIWCTRVSSCYSNGPFNSDLVETFKTNAFNASFNAFVLDRVIGPFGTCNGSLLVFMGGPHHVGWGFFIFNSAGALEQVIFMSRSYQTWFTWLSRNWCLCMWVAWPRDHEVLIMWYQSLTLLIKLYPSKIFVSCCFRKIP